MDELTKGKISDRCIEQFYWSDLYAAITNIPVQMSNGTTINIPVFKRRKDNALVAVPPTLSHSALVECHAKISAHPINEVFYAVDSSPTSPQLKGEAAMQNCVMVHAVVGDKINLHLHNSRENIDPDPFKIPNADDGEWSETLVQLAANNKSSDSKIKIFPYKTSYADAHINKCLGSATGFLHYYDDNITDKQIRLFTNAFYGKQFLSPADLLLLQQMHSYDKLNEDVIFSLSSDKVYYYTCCILSAPNADAIEFGHKQENAPFYLADPKKDPDAYQKEKENGILMLPKDLIPPGLSNKAYEIGRAFFDEKLKRKIVVLQKTEGLLNDRQAKEIRLRLEQNGCKVILQVANDSVTESYAQQIKHLIEEAGFRTTNLAKLLTSFAHPQDDLEAMQSKKRAPTSKGITTPAGSPERKSAAHKSTLAPGSVALFQRTPIARTGEMSEEMQKIANAHFCRIKQRIANTSTLAAERYQEAFAGLLALNGFKQHEDRSWRKTNADGGETIFTIKAISSSTTTPENSDHAIYIRYPALDDEMQALTITYQHGQETVTKSLGPATQDLSEEHQLFHQLHQTLRDKLSESIISSQPVRGDLDEVKSYANIHISCSGDKDTKSHEIFCSPILGDERTTEATKAYQQLVEECFKSGMILLERICNKDGQDLAFIFCAPDCKQAFIICHPTDKHFLTENKLQSHIKPVLNSDTFAEYGIHPTQLLRLSLKHKVPKYFHLNQTPPAAEKEKYPFVDISTGKAEVPSGSNTTKKLIFLTTPHKIKARRIGEFEDDEALAPLTELDDEFDAEAPEPENNIDCLRKTNAQQTYREKIRLYLLEGYKPTAYNIKRCIGGQLTEFTIAIVFRRHQSDLPVVITAPSDKHSIVTPSEVNKALECVRAHEGFRVKPLIVTFDDQQQPDQAEIRISQWCGQIYSDSFKSIHADYEPSRSETNGQLGIVNWARQFLGIRKNRLKVKNSRAGGVDRLQRAKPTLLNSLKNHWQRYWKAYVAAGLIAGSIVVAGLTFGTSLIPEAAGILAFAGTGTLGLGFAAWFGMEDNSFRTARNQTNENHSHSVKLEPLSDANEIRLPTKSNGLFGNALYESQTSSTTAMMGGLLQHHKGNKSAQQPIGKKIDFNSAITDHDLGNAPPGHEVTPGGTAGQNVLHI